MKDQKKAILEKADRKIEEKLLCVCFQQTRRREMLNVDYNDATIPSLKLLCHDVIFDQGKFSKLERRDNNVTAFITKDNNQIYFIVT